ncbi:LPD7 domain-containing protein [Brevundimonas nasdae]|uniref:LPD7 domain-containing protein n=1 Tax=Brevundimonas nasdae TaxID=172043 RepID=UPI003F693330
MADMLKVAQYRRWTRLKVDGDDAFRREVWIQGRAMGLDIKGYQPRDRDRQAAGQTASRRPLEERVRMVSAVIQNLVTDSEAQRRLLNHAAAAIAHIRDRSGEERRSRTHDRQR